MFDIVYDKHFTLQNEIKIALKQYYMSTKYCDCGLSCNNTFSCPICYLNNIQCNKACVCSVCGVSVCNDCIISSLDHKIELDEDLVCKCFVCRN